MSELPPPATTAPAASDESTQSRYTPDIDAAFPAPEPEYVALEWTADSRYVRPRSRQYYSSQLVLVILFSILLFFFQQLAAIVLLWAVFGVTYILAKVQPETVRWQLTTYGIRMQDQLILWEEMTRFWIKDTKGFLQVHVDVPDRVYRQLVILPAQVASLNQVTVDEIAELIGRVLPYQEPIPNRLDKWVEWLEEKFPLESEPASSSPTPSASVSNSKPSVPPVETAVSAPPSVKPATPPPVSGAR